MARVYAQGLSQLGFQTYITTVRRTTGVTDIHIHYVHYRCLRVQQRTFATEAAARVFQDRLPHGTRHWRVPG